MNNYLLGALGFSLLVNILMFLIAFKLQTDKFTDISYSLSFILLAGYGLATCHATGFHLLIFGLISIWALRLGSFLLYRVWKKGKDARFDEMRTNFWKFGRFWLLQGLAVWVILIPALLALHYHFAHLTVLGVFGVILWITGLLIESIADWQKYKFSVNLKNKGKWIESGLWKYSRHPNYLGEMKVWIGVYLIVFNSLTTKSQLVGLISPLFIVGLLMFVSGIPILEKNADKRWGKDKSYVAYKARTSVLFLLPNKRIK